jgi:hypothetical protein
METIITIILLFKRLIHDLTTGYAVNNTFLTAYFVGKLMIIPFFSFKTKSLL